MIVDRAAVAAVWSESIVPALQEYIRIPNQSPAFDADWRAHGHMDRAVMLARQWIESRRISGLVVEVVQLDGRTPVLVAELPGRSDDTILLYGHLDKQPPMHGWGEGLAPWTPVIRDGRLYGRGGADDGYAVFASIAALAELRRRSIPHARCVVLIETCEESGSYDLPAYLDALAPRIGTPSLVVCLDSGCGDYERLWVTTSLRGVGGGTLSVSTLEEGVHSGAATGIVPSTFRIARRLLDRIEDADSGRILLPELHAAIPEQRQRQIAAAAAVLGDGLRAAFAFAGETRPMSADPAELLRNRTWMPGIEITGADGLPPIANAGNVLRPTTALKVSVRIPPTVDGRAATAAIKRTLESEPPYGAEVRFAAEHAADGWNAPPEAPWLTQSLERASRAYFGKPACYIGEGGTIPFMAMLGVKFPAAQFVITGVLGPKSNAHGPNEFLHLETAERLTCCIAQVVADHSGTGNREPGTRT
jgi:acetylornithine deacetylase/succinyl-diaminopimelate desuccinylase-like protein